MTVESAINKLIEFEPDYKVFNTCQKDKDWLFVQVPNDEVNYNLFRYLIKNISYLSINDLLDELDLYPLDSTVRLLNSKLMLEIIDTNVDRYPEIIDWKLNENNMVIPEIKINPYLKNFQWDSVKLRKSSNI